jgi:hypothetical protein
MHTAIKIPLKALHPLMVKDLQQKYPSAVVRIEAEVPTEGTAMQEDAFWGIVSQLDWGRKRSEDIIAPAIEALSSFSEADIFRFDQLLAEKLHALDGEAYARPLGWGGTESPHFSVDVFLYARCCAVTNGRDFYEKVRKQPSLMPKDYTFEPILYLAEKAHRLKTGADHYDFLPSVSYETFSNKEGWTEAKPLLQLLKGSDK